MSWAISCDSIMGQNNHKHTINLHELKVILIALIVEGFANYHPFWYPTFLLADYVVMLSQMVFKGID